MTDSFGRNIDYLRVSVTELCNLRCRYCMPENGIVKKRHEDMLSEDELIAAVRAAVSLGFKKLRVTGGEPLVKKNILSICERAAKTGIGELCLTTNGTLLAPLASSLKSAGVNRINISLDTLNPDRYAEITRRGSLYDALSGLHAALNAGFKRIKINAVLIGGFNDSEITDFAELTQKYPVDVRFIELMPMPFGERFDTRAYLPCSAVTDALPELKSIPSDGGTAKLYKLPNSRGNIGLISPLSDSFCPSCRRLRLTADGKLKPCLHSGEEYSIKGLDYNGVVETFKRAVLSKPACRPPLSPEHLSEAGRGMNSIGG